MRGRGKMKARKIVAQRYNKSQWTITDLIYRRHIATTKLKRPARSQKATIQPTEAGVIMPLPSTSNQPEATVPPVVDNPMEGEVMNHSEGETPSSVQNKRTLKRTKISPELRQLIFKSKGCEKATVVAERYGICRQNVSLLSTLQ